MTWDAFISHASEDKETVARPLAEALHSHNLRVWFDEFTLRPGSRLRRLIDQGLRSSHFGIVVLSPAFLRKEWPQSELDGLFSIEMSGRSVIVPIWHGVNIDDVVSYSPMIADRVAISTSKGLDQVVVELLELIQPKAFATSECVIYLTDRCGFEHKVVRDAITAASGFGEFVELLIQGSGRTEMSFDMAATFDLPNARVGLNNAREILGLTRLPHEFF